MCNLGGDYVAQEGLTEQDLVKIRQALEQPTLREAIFAMERVLARLGYVWAERLGNKEHYLAGKKDKT